MWKSLNEPVKTAFWMHPGSKPDSFSQCAMVEVKKKGDYKKSWYASGCMSRWSDTKLVVCE